VVKDGTILWIGHPMMGLEETLKKVTAGSFSLAQAKKEFAQQQAGMQQQSADNEEMQKLTKPYMDALRVGDLPGEIKALDAIEAKKPEMKEAIDLTKAMPMISLGMKGGYEIVRKAIEGPMKANAQFLNQVAWTIVQPKPAAKDPDYAYALKLAKQAVDLSNGDPSIRDTYALALWKTGEKIKATEQESMAVDAMKKNAQIPPATLQECEERLAEFKKG
jgi:hypothetical protein